MAILQPTHSGRSQFRKALAWVSEVRRVLRRRERRLPAPISPSHSSCKTPRKITDGKNRAAAIIRRSTRTEREQLYYHAESEKLSKTAQFLSLITNNDLKIYDWLKTVLHIQNVIATMGGGTVNTGKDMTKSSSHPAECDYTRGAVRRRDRREHYPSVEVGSSFGKSNSALLRYTTLARPRSGRHLRPKGQERPSRQRGGEPAQRRHLRAQQQQRDQGKFPAIWGLRSLM